MGLTMDLRTLLTRGGLPLPPDGMTRNVTGVTCDSRQVAPGHLFVAVRGAAQDGSQFIEEAVRRGACAVITESDVTLAADIVGLRVDDTRQAVTQVAQAWYGAPARDLMMIGVTGTNGKTTVTHLIHHLLPQAGRPCGLIGTIESRTGGRPSPSHNTTPGPLELAALLAQMRRAKLHACAMEVSSHALDQQRVAGITFHAAVFTNASPEHLDYHRTFEAYVRAKAELFRLVPSWGTAVLNAEDPASTVMRRHATARVVTFGVGTPADVTITGVQYALDGSAGTLVTPAGTAAFQTPLVGRHNLENAAAAAAVGTACGISASTVAAALATFPGVPGRLERVEAGQPFPIFVDYAHTDAALAHVLSTVRRLTDRRLIVVFGCGGDRDRAKRPRMGAAAGQYADRIIVTSDNPRSESPQAIAEAICAGIPSTASAIVLLDRAQAIRQALVEADARSVVVIAGKGHETTQIFRDHTIMFDDRQVVREALMTLEGVHA